MKEQPIDLVTLRARLKFDLNALKNPCGYISTAAFSTHSGQIFPLAQPILNSLLQPSELGFLKFYFCVNTALLELNCTLKKSIIPFRLEISYNHFQRRNTLKEHS